MMEIEDVKYYLDLGFQAYAIMTPSGKYTQGIDIWYPSNPIKSDKVSAVYVLANRDGHVLKIGETDNLTSRFYRGYRCISNSTNNRIREHVREVENIYVYVFLLPKVKDKILGFPCETSYAEGLEKQLLLQYKKHSEKVPDLNVMLK
jgi:hypothetical protein